MPKNKKSPARPNSFYSIDQAGTTNNTNSWMKYTSDVIERIVEYTQEREEDNKGRPLEIVHLFDAPTKHKRGELLKEWEKAVSNKDSTSPVHTREEMQWVIQPVLLWDSFIRAKSEIPEWFIVTSKRGEEFRHIGLQKRKATGLVLSLIHAEKLFVVSFCLWKIKSRPRATNEYFKRLTKAIERRVVVEATDEFEIQWRKKAEEVTAKNTRKRVAALEEYAAELVLHTIPEDAYTNRVRMLMVKSEIKQLIFDRFHDQPRETVHEFVDESVRECRAYALKIASLMKVRIMGALMRKVERMANHGDQQIVSEDVNDPINELVVGVCHKISTEVGNVIYRDMLKHMGDMLDSCTVIAVSELLDGKIMEMGKA